MAEGFADQRWPVVLHHGDVTLRPMRHRDAGDWEQVRRHNAGWLRPWEATLPQHATPGPQTYGSLIRHLNRQARQGRMLPWLIIYQPEQHSRSSRPVLAGQLTVSGIVGGSAASAQIGYWVDQRWAGRGLVPTAVAMAMDYCFDVLRLHRIEVAIRPENARSLRVVEKLGFRPEGLRPRYLHIDGDWRDHLIFALNSDEVGDGMINRWELTRNQDQQAVPGSEPAEGA
ncbi:N-acetyltransferase GCN5 [Microlunatus endophyticus]|uniref:N-acetyltransferase GCN5 n=1 Tax=Microlunatus endophyticus TaxID=1716077 RepID=A0A917SH50_9ACTN|nr:GNAT family protein [Microlunatus endophyticus]GGL80075.1 N-acetyltransferase GCN5 [Microlunatus endophyticus]